jgi:hypothetical protein
MKRLVLVLLMTSATARVAEVAATPASDHVPLLLSLDAETVWHLDPSYRLFSSDRSDTGGGASFRYDVRRLLRGTLAIGAGLHGSSNSTRVLEGQNAELSIFTPSLSAVMHWPVHRWLEPELRVAVDASWTKMSLSTIDGASLSGRAFSPGASAGAGLILRTSSLATALRGGTLGLAGAFIIEGGFHVGTPLDFDLARSRPADDKLANDQLPTGSTAIGTLGRSQPYLRLSFALLI